MHNTSSFSSLPADATLGLELATLGLELELIAPPFSTEERFPDTDTAPPAGTFSDVLEAEALTPNKITS